MIFHPDSGSSLWIQDLINGLSGLTIRTKHSVFCDASPFQKIEVFDTYSYGLVLCLAGTIVFTEADGFIYNEMMVHPAMIMHDNPHAICIIGGGDGGCLTEVLRHNTVKKAVAVEIDEMVKETIEKPFPDQSKGFKDPRVQVVIEDGYQYLKSNEGSFDVILVDSYDPCGPVQSLETADFHQLVAERLNNRGIAVFQTDSPVARGEILRNTIESVSPFFRYKRPFICSMRSFPEGVCSFLLCSQDDAAFDNFDNPRYETIMNDCRYYNKDIHSGAFMLPQYMKPLINS
ncbi:MAG: polyamine aminopropyltransferase [Deltaproteobacteria bacterium]|nr:polyamine aminopropyltransferase [Deltaproteobacteria bacterium]